MDNIKQHHFEFTNGTKVLQKIKWVKTEGAAGPSRIDGEK